MCLSKPGVNWKSVMVYYVLACAMSWPFFWWRDLHRASWAAWDIPVYLKTSFIMWGPGLAALVCLYLFRRSHPRTVTFFGRSRAESAAFYVVPLLALAAVYMPEVGSRVALVGLIGAAGLFNTLGEELGWRGFLQDALQSTSPAKRYILIGAM